MRNIPSSFRSQPHAARFTSNTCLTSMKHLVFADLTNGRQSGQTHLADLLFPYLLQKKLSSVDNSAEYKKTKVKIAWKLCLQFRFSICALATLGYMISRRLTRNAGCIDTHVCVSSLDYLRWHRTALRSWLSWIARCKFNGQSHPELDYGQGPLVDRQSAPPR